MSNIKKVAVIGGGTMGNGIAHIFSLRNFDVHLVETKQEFLDRAFDTIHKNLDKMVKKERIKESDKDSAISHLNGTLDLQRGVKDVDLVVEAIPENYELKKSLFSKVTEYISGHTILASNTSSISITKLAATTSCPDRFIGMHFFNPVPVMKLVEIVRGFETNENVCTEIEETARELGKVPVFVNDSPGFVSNRVLMPMINEAIYCVYEGVATAENVDDVMKLGMAHPMGPLKLADFIGLDVCLDILQVLYDGFKDPKYRPCPLLVKMVDAGKLGNKSGEGFFRHN